jgi:hypothetical protein
MPISRAAIEQGAAQVAEAAALVLLDVRGLGRLPFAQDAFAVPSISHLAPEQPSWRTTMKTLLC